MTGIKDRSFAPLPGNLSLEDLVPKENFYRRLHDVLDLSFVSVEEVYDQRKLEVVDEIFAADFTLHDPDLPRGARGPEGIKRIVETFVDAFPDLQVTLDDELSLVEVWNSRKLGV